MSKRLYYTIFVKMFSTVVFIDQVNKTTAKYKDSLLKYGYKLRTQV